MKGGTVDSSREWFEETEDFNQPIFPVRDPMSTRPEYTQRASADEFHNKAQIDAIEGFVAYEVLQTAAMTANDGRPSKFIWITTSLQFPIQLFNVLESEMLA